jgi:hypothetical protein
VALFLGGNMSSEGKILISFAWAIEIVGVTAGVFNSTYTTFGDELPTTFAGYIPAVPMVALAVAEVGRVPLASVIFHKHKLTQVIAVFGIPRPGLPCRGELDVRVRANRQFKT